MVVRYVEKPIQSTFQGLVMQTCTLETKLLFYAATDLFFVQFLSFKEFSAKRIEYWLPVGYAWVQYTPGEPIHIFSIGPMKGSALTNGFCFSFHVLIGFSRTVFSLVYEDVFGFA